MSAIFISHSSKDNTLATELQVWLFDKGHRSIFLDFDPENGIPAGRNWERELYTKLRACQAVIVLCSEHSMASQWCFAEITQARSLGKHIFPVKVDGCQLCSVLEDVQVTDLTFDPVEAYQRLFSGLKKAGLDPADLFDWDPKRPPYPGLPAFQEQDAAVYFGRDDAIQSALETLNRLQRLGGSRWVLILGASGSGKSSLVRAGIIPRLRRNPDHWLVLDPFRPMRRPFDELAMVLTGAFGRSESTPDWKSIRTALDPSADRPNATQTLEMANDLRVATKMREATILLVVDQFEELLRPDDSGMATRFLHLLRALTGQDGNPFLVVATLRSDFLGQLQAHPATQGVAYENILLGPMGPGEFAQVIEGPACVAGLELGPGLVQAMVADTVAQDALPLLAFTLRELWVHSGSDSVLTASEYRDLGRLQGAVARSAAAIYSECKPSEEQSRHLRQAFRAMVRLGAEGQPVRQPAGWAELPEDVHPLLERFVQARLLVSRGEGAARFLDVAHEALFRSWDDLRQWLEADQKLLVWREQLRNDLARWNGTAQDEGSLLRGGGLLEAEGWLVEHAEDLTPAEREFIQASVGVRERERVAREQQRRRLVYVLSGASLFFLVLAGVAGWQWLDAEEQRKVAQERGRLALSRQLAAQARSSTNSSTPRC